MKWIGSGLLNTLLLCCYNTLDRAILFRLKFDLMIGTEFKKQNGKNSLSLAFGVINQRVNSIVLVFIHSKIFINSDIYLICITNRVTYSH